MHKVIPRDRFWELFPFVFSWDVLEGERYFNRKFKEVYSPSSYVALDELTCKFKGKTKNKVYLPRKKVRTGIKIWSLNDSTPGATYLYDFATYLKEDARRYPDSDGPPLGATVRGLLNYADSVLPEHCFITADRYFGSLDNGLALSAKGRGFMFSCRADRPRSFWEPITNSLAGKDPGTTLSMQHKDTGITAFAFKDRLATLLLLSNGIRSWGLLPETHGYDKAPRKEEELKLLPEREQNKWKRPLARSLYNYAMRGSDVFAQRLEAFRYNKRQKTWKRAVRLYHVGMTLCNAFILYGLIRKERGQGPINHYAFLEKLIEELSERKGGGNHVICHDRTG